MMICSYNFDKMEHNCNDPPPEINPGSVHISLWQPVSDDNNASIQETAQNIVRYSVFIRLSLLLGAAGRILFYYVLKARLAPVFRVFC